jgi:hypothetical protein
LHVPASTSESTELAAGVVPLSTMFHRERHIARKQPLAMK